MPVQKASNVIIRQWELLKLLPKTGSGKTVIDLKNDLNNLGFDIKERQVERDLKHLQGQFSAIECYDDSKPYTWRWAKDGTRPIIGGISLPEAVSWKLVADTIQHLLPISVLNTIKPYFTEAQKKLDSLKENNDLATWNNKIRVVQPNLPLVAPQIHHDIVESIQEAVLHQNQVNVTYRAANSNYDKEMILHPLALVQRGLVTYVVATANEHTDVRLFALHRIQQIEVSTRRASIPRSFNIDHYIGDGKLHFGNGEQIFLKIRVANWLKHILQETPLTNHQEILEENNHIIVTTLISLTPQLEWWLLSQADGLEVLEPIELREKIANRLLLAAEQYKLNTI